MTQPTNPKQIYGESKPSIEHVSPIALAWLAIASQEGAKKYGTFNYRQSGVEAGTYISAVHRHTQLWFSGEQVDPATGIHHLAYAMANMAILIDCEATGKMIDNRPKDDGHLSRLLSAYTKDQTPSVDDELTQLASQIASKYAPKCYTLENEGNE